MYTVVVTGATGVLGRAIIARLRDHKRKFVLVGRNRRRLEQSAIDASPAQATFVVADFADPTAAITTFQQIERLDALINIAGEQGPIGPLWRTDQVGWERTFRVNFLTPAALCREAIIRFGREGGKIINISGGGAAGPRPNLTAYACAKTALVRLTETLASELRERGIDVNAIAPGPISSSMTEAILQAGPDRCGAAEFAAAQKIAAASQHNEAKAADLVAYLLSPVASGITGRFISALWDDWATLHERWPLANQDQFTLRRVS